MRVLVIEDDEELAETVAAGLRNARMAVDVALDGAPPRAGARAQYDVILLDRDLPVAARRQRVPRAVAAVAAKVAC